MRISILLAALILAAPAIAAPEPKLKLDYLEAPPIKAAGRNPRAIEEATGGRLGVALVDSKGAVLLGFNRQDRFAMCSTFKAPLAAAVLAGAEKGRFTLDGELSFSKADVIANSPVVEANLARGRLSIANLAEAAVQQSDNAAANLLLPLVGGPEGLTAFFRAHGDEVSRLDRPEPDLNENAIDDPRDTTAPEAIAGLMARLIFRDMPAESAATFRSWLQGSKTGDQRVRAGLPKGWTAGDKTGTCGTAYNDVAVLRSPTGNDYVLAVYLDRPTVEAEQAEAAIAEVAAAAIGILQAIEARRTANEDEVR
jgi:beta-lactamase class A